MVYTEIKVKNDLLRSIFFDLIYVNYMKGKFDHEN